MTYSSQGQDRGRGDFIDKLNEAIRQNPVPAALIGAGLCWMFMGGAKNTVLGGASRTLFSGFSHSAKQAGEAAYRGARELGAKVAEGASVIAETAGEVRSQAAGAVRDVGGVVSGATSQTASQAAEVAKATYDAAGNLIRTADHSMSRQSSEAFKGFQEALAGMFDKQPLLLGAVGVAVGAAIAASLPASNMENRLVGDTADSLKDKAQELLSETSKRAEAMATKGLEEAKVQGLTPEAAGKALRGLTEKVMGAADVAKESAGRRIKG